MAKERSPSFKLGKTPPNKTALTTLELKIIAAIVAGKSNHEIAEQYSLGAQTITNCVNRIFRKLGVHNRLERALYAIHCGLAGKQPAWVQEAKLTE
jgi:DNA-binding NarL/FixJ family response regulator